jgi:hypothetical protein
LTKYCVHGCGCEQRRRGGGFEVIDGRWRIGL